VGQDFDHRALRPDQVAKDKELRGRQERPHRPLVLFPLQLFGFFRRFLAAGFGWSGIGFTFVSSTGAVVLASGKVAPAGTIHCSEVAVPAFPVRVSMRLGSTFCFASPPEMYAFTSTARSPARFLRLSFGPAFPTTTSLASESFCKLSATSSSVALHVLSTPPRLLTLGYAHSFTLVACGGGGGGGFSIVTVLEVEADKPRESVQMAPIVMGPEEAPAVFRVAEFPLPEILPPLEVHRPP